MATPTLLYVTQVAPYRDGPAGVHGVLDQSATAVAQLAESAGLVRSTGDRRAGTRARRPGGGPGGGLFTIGETPWSPRAADQLLDGVRSGRTSVLAIHSATDSCYRWDDYGRWSAPASTAIPGPGVHSRCRRPRPSRGRPPRPHLDLARRGLHLPRAPTRRPGALTARAAELGRRHGDDGPARNHPLSWCFTEGPGGSSPRRSDTSPTPGRAPTISAIWPAVSSGSLVAPRPDRTGLGGLEGRCSTTTPGSAVSARSPPDRLPPPALGDP